MTNLILDANFVGELCTTGTNSSELLRFVEVAQQGSFKLWLYTAQMTEILQFIGHVNNHKDYEEHCNQWETPAGSIFEKLERNCQWLAALSEDALAINDSDPLTAALIRASDRLGEESMVVTIDSQRLSFGHPFIEPSAVLQIKHSNPISYIDLESQQDRIRSAIERNVHRVLHHGRYVMGSEITALENKLAEYVGTDYCVCVSSGTDALLIAMMSHDIGSGDEVITTPFTFFAAVEAIKLLGAKPVYVDIDPRLYTLDPIHLEAVITDRTKAIIPVSLYGQCADMDRINDVAALHQISVIEDAAQSFGATYKGKRSCGLSQIGCTSFFPAKPLGAYGDAGACFTDDRELAARMYEIRDHGQRGRYQHVRIGINGRMDSIQAAVLSAKLEIFDEELASRAQVADTYSELLKPTEASGRLILPRLEPHNVSAWAQYTVEVSQRSHVQNVLSTKGIPTAVHYPKPVYAQPALAESVTHCPVTDSVAERVLSLPMHPYLSVEVQELIASSLNQALNC